MLHEYIQSIVQYLHAHPHWGGVITFIAAFVESLAVIGTIVPGSVTMTAIGILVGTDILPPGPTILWAVFGAYAGDCLSYWFGWHFNERIRRMWPFYKYPHWLAKGEAFFKLHGGKSVLIGRFTGPVRSIVPMIAGILLMRPIRFLPICFITAVIWALVYMLPGIIIGALSLELPPAVATKFILMCLLAIAIIWGFTWLIKFFVNQTWNQIDRLLIKNWNYLNTHKSSHWFTNLLRNPRHEEDHQQLVRAVFAIIFAVAFCFIAFSLVTKSTIVHLNLPIFNLLQSLRAKPLDDLMLAMTALGDKKVLFIMGFIVFLWLGWKRRWWTAIHWGALIVISAAAIEFFKRLVNSPRPPLVAMTDPTSSFPSGHTLLSLTMFGFLAVIIADNLPRNRRALIYQIVFVLVALVGLSRIYLGAHWLTDIFAAVFLGMAILLVTVISYRKRNVAVINPASFAIFAGVITFIIWIGYCYFNFSTIRQTYATYWPTQMLLMDQWWQEQPNILPLYRNSRIGHPAQPFNIQWLASLSDITNDLTAQGWKTESPKLDLQSTLNRLLPNSAEKKLPLIPLLYHNRQPVLFMTKVQPNNGPVVILRLWQSDVVINEQPPLWIGFVYYYQPPSKLISLDKKPDGFASAVDLLKQDLKKNYNLREIVIPSAQQPAEMQSLKWDGRLLLIRAK